MAGDLPGTLPEDRKDARRGVLPPRDLVRILEIQVDRVTMDQALERISSMVRAGGPFQVLTPNVDHVMRALKDPAFREIYRDGDLVVADGAPLVWASRFLGDPLPERVAGSDLTPRLCALAAERGFSVFFMGGLPGSARAAAEILREKHPSLRVAGWDPAPLGFDKDPDLSRELEEKIRKAGPDLLFVALGSPKQDAWIHEHKDRLGVPVSMGVGATLDFISGKVKRAPLFFQRAGLEWFWRLLSEPRRLWKRYLLDDMPFFWHILRERFRRRREAERG